MKIVYIDVDDTTFDLVPHWVDEFLRQYPECEDPRLKGWYDWDIAPLIPAEYQDRFWDILGNPELYDRVALIPGALEGVQAIRAMGARVVFVTSAVNGHAGVKLRKLVQHGLLDTVVRNRDYIETFDKSLLRGDLIIDDRPQTCRKFVQANGRYTALLYLRPPAIRPDYRRGLPNASDWTGVVEMTRKLLNREYPSYERR